MLKFRVKTMSLANPKEIKEFLNRFVVANSRQQYEVDYFQSRRVSPGSESEDRALNYSQAGTRSSVRTGK